VVRYELKGQAAEQAREYFRTHAGATATSGSAEESFTFVVRSIEDVKAVAAYLGVDIPSGRGRFPMKRLEESAARQGHRIDRSEYDGTVAVIPGTYRVSFMEIVGDKVYSRTGIVTGEQVKKYMSGRGRPSKDSVVSAAIDAYGWGETYLADSVVVDKQD